MRIGFEAKRAFHNKTGLGNYSRDLIRILSKFYPKNTYYLFNPKKSKESLLTVNNENVFEITPPNFFLSFFKNYWRQFAVTKEIKQNNIQIFHGLSGELPFGLMKYKIKSVVTIHDLIFIRYPELYSYFDRKIHYYKFKKAAKNADLIIAISEQTKQDIVDFLKIDSSKIRVVYQGCHDSFKVHYSDECKKGVLDKYNISNKYILNVGTIEERKNALIIVKALNKVDINIDLVLIGKQKKYAKEIHDYIKEHHLEHRVHFLQGVTQEELAILYQKASVFVYPSIFEGFGIPIIEALFSKVPVITSNSGVFPEAGGPNSYYINPLDENALSETVKWIFLNPDEVRSNVEKSYKYVQKFADKNIVNDLYNVYQELLV